MNKPVAPLALPTEAASTASFKEIGARLSNWGRWGAQDRRGTLNFITPDRVAAAARLMRRGEVFDLGVPFGGSGFQFGGGHRPNPIHLMSMMPADTQSPDGAGFVDDFIIMPVQTATQWDGLAHCFYDDRLYNGHSISTITAVHGARELGIHHLTGGVAGRGVLLDVAALKGVTSLPHGTAIVPADLDAAEARQGVRAGSGDILLIRTGWPAQMHAPRARPSDAAGSGLRLPREAGLSLDCCAWLHERQIAAVAADNYAIEVIPAGDAATTLPVHCVLIRDMGMTLGELFALDALAHDCEADHTWEFFFVAPPLRLTNGVGSPINPIAIK